MDIKNIYDILDEIRNSIMIIDKKRNITWLNSWAREMLEAYNINIGSKFDDFFLLDKNSMGKYFGHSKKGESFTINLSVLKSMNQKLFYFTAG